MTLASLSCRGFLLLCCLLLSSGCGARRQSADSNFDVSVQRAAFTDGGPAVLFDEAHKNIHKADGLYEPFVRLIRNDGYNVTVNASPFTATSLAGARILVIANALGTNDSNDSSAFTPEECNVVRDWVAGGGSLLLITDHAPTGAAAEALAGRFGVAMSKGFTEDPVHFDSASTDYSQLLFTRGNSLLREHPIMEGRDPSEQIRRVVSFTGQSLKREGSVGEFLGLSPTAINRPASLRVERSGGDVRVIIEYGDGQPATGFAQGLAFVFGTGRVVMVGEAAMLTAQIDGRTEQPFGMNIPGVDNKQLALNIMHWLSGLI